MLDALFQGELIEESNRPRGSATFRAEQRRLRRGDRCRRKTALSGEPRGRVYREGVVSALNEAGSRRGRSSVLMS